MKIQIMLKHKRNKTLEFLYGLANGGYDSFVPWSVALHLFFHRKLNREILEENLIRSLSLASNAQKEEFEYIRILLEEDIPTDSLIIRAKNNLIETYNLGE